MKRMIRLTRIAAAGLMLTMVAGCGGGGGGHDASYWNPQIVNVYSYLVKAVQAESISDTLSYVSNYYLQDGSTYQDFDTTFTQLYADYQDVKMDVNITNITYDNLSDPTYAYVEFTQRITGVNIKTQAIEVISDDTASSMVWRWEDGYWRMYGDQKSASQTSSLAKIGSVKYLLGGKPRS